MGLKFLKTFLPGVYEIEHIHLNDDRGFFMKQYSTNLFINSPFTFEAKESFTTMSNKKVLRGMHCQYKYAKHKKLVTCIQGSVLDVVVDIRKESKLFNKPYSIKLSENQNKSLLIGYGYAHGFLSLEDNTILQYITSYPYVSELDSGVNWNSIDFKWPGKNFFVSERDSLLPSIHEHKILF